MVRLLLLPLMLLALLFPLSAQNTEISGKITESETGKPIPYANIYFSGTYVGTMSDVNGNYRLLTGKPGPVIEVSAIGFKKQSAPVKINQKNVIDFKLKEESYMLGEIDVEPGENPANILLRHVIENKKINNPAVFPSWKSRIYAKTELDLKNVKSSMRKRKLFKQFDFVFNYIDSLELEGKTFLPVFFNETVSNFYHDAENNRDREEIIANKASGMTVDMYSQFTGKMYENLNIYDNYVTLSEIGFVSPINSLGLQFYKYYLLDSTESDGSKIYEVSFLPKLPQEPVFKGKMWIEDGTFAVSKLEMQLSDKANVNFVNNLQYSIEYQKKEGKWAPRNESLIADVDVEKDKDSKRLGFIARKTNVYENFEFASVAATIEKFKDPIVVSKDVMKADELFWTNARPVELQEREKNIYIMVDSIKGVKLYRTAAEYVYMFYYGYRDLGKFELGPYYYLYSNNKVEGSRVRLGVRTTYKWDKNLRLNAYGAYGFLDQKFKYGGGAEYYFSVKPLSLISFQMQHDMEMIGKSSYNFVEQNIMTTLLRKYPNTKLNLIERFDLAAKKEWRLGLMHDFSFGTSKIYTAPFVPLIDKQGKEINSIQSTEVSMGIRYAPGEDVIVDNFDRNVYANYDPTLTFMVTQGLKNFFGGDYNYTKLYASLSDRVTLNPIGYSTYLLQAGKIWGDVPFPYLKVHEGNETFVYDPNAFNLMKYQEFVSDTYVSLFYEHHFVGFFLNKIPLFRRLKWREVVGVRSLWGQYHPEHHDSLILPVGMKGLSNKPYTEFSVGLENIFKFVRIDGIWRANYNETTKSQFGLFVTLQITL